MNFRFSLLIIALLFLLSFSVCAQYAGLYKKELKKVSYSVDRGNPKNANSDYIFPQKQFSAGYTKVQSKNNIEDLVKDGPIDVCSNWMQINTNNGAFQIGDLDLP